MRKFLFILFIILNKPAYAEVIKILATDKAMHVYSDASLKSDPNKYETLYEIDTDKKIIKVIYDKDLRTNEMFDGKAIYKIVDKQTDRSSFKDSIKGIYINPITSGIETIVFCENQFHYSKTQDQYINLSSGSYKVIN